MFKSLKNHLNPRKRDIRCIQLIYAAYSWYALHTADIHCIQLICAAYSWYTLHTADMRCIQLIYAAYSWYTLHTADIRCIQLIYAAYSWWLTCVPWYCRIPQKLTFTNSRNKEFNNLKRFRRFMRIRQFLYQSKLLRKPSQIGHWNLRVMSQLKLRKQSLYRQ